MAKESKITIDLSGLEELRRQIGAGYYTRVGILGSKTDRTSDDGGTATNAEIGVMMEFGTEDIPPRSWLRFPIEYKMKELVQFMASASVRLKIEKNDIIGVFKLIGLKAEAIIQSAFASRGFGQWAPLQQSTIDAKGSNVPLIDTSQLRRAVSSDVVKKDG